MIRGSCLCAGIRYEISDAFEEMHHCHCSRCRKAHAAAFSTFARTRKDNVRFVAGEPIVQHYRSSALVERSFCRQCGSSLFFGHDAFPDAIWVAVGTLDDDPGMRPEAHIFAASGAPWHAIADALPQFDEYPPEA